MCIRDSFVDKKLRGLRVMQPATPTSTSAPSTSTPTNQTLPPPPPPPPKSQEGQQPQGPSQNQTQRPQPQQQGERPPLPQQNQTQGKPQQGERPQEQPQQRPPQNQSGIPLPPRNGNENEGPRPPVNQTFDISATSQPLTPPKSQGSQGPQGPPPPPPPFVAIRGANCTVSADCSNNGCIDENNNCRCKPGFSGIRCEKSQEEVFGQLNQGRNEAQAIAKRGPPANAQSAREIAVEIQNLAQRQDRPLPAGDLRDLTAQIKAAANVNGGNVDNLKAIASLGPKFIETGRRDDAGFQPGANSSLNLTNEQLNENERQKREVLRNSSLDQIRLIEQELKRYAANQRGNLQSGAELPLPDMNGIKGTIARLDFGGCGKPQGPHLPPIGQGNQTNQSQLPPPPPPRQGNQTNQSQLPVPQITAQAAPAGQQVQVDVQGQSQVNCGPPPPKKDGIPDPPQDRIKSPTYKFSIQNPAATNLPTADASNASAVAATSSQQAFVNIPQSIGSRVSADAQFSFTASANSFVPNLNNKKYFGASPVYSVGFSNSNGTEVKIANLDEPVRLCVPTPPEIAANSSVSPTCAYIDPAKPDDIDISVEDDPNPPAGMTCCYLNHFSSFTIVGQTKSAVMLFVSVFGAILALFTLTI
eukprot:TRINITY_DN2384_c0_g2_i2.p1 TRINITY_DN2384_c0_g2~~TRINITY_DN2384_c0_g2_i2.p1  ORF type:complete len:668 (+),score=217.73 TRINITY_DN2384_c0_g2_i2:79-2004(+)